MTSRPPAFILAVAALFVISIGYLMITSLAPREVPTFTPTAGPLPGAAVGRAVDTITIDARAARTWRFFDAERRAVVDPPDTAGWDLAFQRHHIIAARGLRDLGPRALDSIGAVPRAGYVANVVRSDTTNPATRNWYRYSFVSHLLEPAGHVYAAPLGDDRYVAFEILSYYCPGPEAGCLTLRYALRPGPP